MIDYRETKTLDYCPETGEYVTVTRGVYTDTTAPYHVYKRSAFHHVFSHEELRRKASVLFDAMKRCRDNNVNDMEKIFAAFAHRLHSKCANDYL